MTLTLRQGLGSGSKGEVTLKRLYRIGEFAKKASVSLRTLRYYDQIGLLSPGEHTESGYRQYADEDLLTLQHILALKFLGFSLDEIRTCIQRGPRQLAEVLAQQRAMMEEKRAQLEAVIRAIGETETLLEAGTCDWEAVARVIDVIRMEKKNEWVKKYFTDEQLQTMNELGNQAYSDEARRKLDSRQGEWTEADQERATADWTHVYAEARRLGEAGADPAGPEAQAVAKLKHSLLSAFTQGDPEISAGLNQFWASYQELPAESKPFDASPFDAGEAGNALLEKASAIYQESLG
ncbi:MAG: MerR family transcriptional regulator [Actinomycetota bacterium]